MHKGERPPIWWVKVSGGLTSSVRAAKLSFYTAGVIVGFEEEDNQKIGYIIRLNDEEVGYYSKETLGNKDLPIGVRLKNRLPEPETIVDSPQLSTFTFEVLREQIKLVPRMWLKKQIDLLLNNQKILPPQNPSFKNWVLLNSDKKKDRYLINLLEAAVKYEGLKGLSRFNDYAAQ